MIGIIDQIEKKMAKNNKAYHALTVDGERYSVWDAEIVKNCKEGDTVEIEWGQSGDFKNLTSLKVVAGGSGVVPTNKYNPVGPYFSYAKDITVALIAHGPAPKDIGNFTAELGSQLYEASMGGGKNVDVQPQPPFNPSPSESEPEAAEQKAESPIEETTENTPFNRIEWGDTKVGVITNGISYHYVITRVNPSGSIDINYSISHCCCCC